MAAVAAVRGRRRSRQLAGEEAAVAAAAAAAAATAAGKSAGSSSAGGGALLSALAEVRFGPSDRSGWRRRLLQLTDDGRYLRVAAADSSLSDRPPTVPATQLALEGLLLAPTSTPGECGFRLQSPAAAATDGSNSDAATTLFEARRLGKLELGTWIKQLTLSTGLASAYEPAAELLDLASARAAEIRQRDPSFMDSSNGVGGAVSGVGKRRASMPAVSLGPELAAVAARQASIGGMQLRPLPPTPPEAAAAAAAAAEITSSARRRGSLMLPASSAVFY